MTLREEKKLAVWRGIRAAALRLFEEQGYRATTVDQIAAAANVSRATFFNHFASKEAVVFDQDPQERSRWRAIMAARPDDEPLWDALSAIMLQFSETLRDRMVLQRRLKAQDPSLVQATQNFGNQFRADLQNWVHERTPPGDDPLTPTLQLNLMLACSATAYQTWQQDETFDDFLRRLERCLREAAPRPGDP